MTKENQGELQEGCKERGGFGAPDTNRTCDPSLRRAVLYPTELLARGSDKYYITSGRHSNLIYSLSYTSGQGFCR